MPERGQLGMHRRVAHTARDRTLSKQRDAMRLGSPGSTGARSGRRDESSRRKLGCVSRADEITGCRC